MPNMFGKTTEEVPDEDYVDDYVQHNMGTIIEDDFQVPQKLNIGDLWGGVSEYDDDQPETSEKGKKFNEGHPLHCRFMNPLTGYELAERLDFISNHRKGNVPDIFALTTQACRSTSFLLPKPGTDDNMALPRMLLEHWTRHLHSPDDAEIKRHPQDYPPFDYVEVPKAPALTGKAPLSFIDRKGYPSTVRQLKASVDEYIDKPEDAEKDTYEVSHRLFAVEVIQLCNLCPQSVREAKNLIPSLSRIPYEILWHYVNVLRNNTKTYVEEHIMKKAALPDDYHAKRAQTGEAELDHIVNVRKRRTYQDYTMEEDIDFMEDEEGRAGVVGREAKIRKGIPDAERAAERRKYYEMIGKRKQAGMAIEDLEDMSKTPFDHAGAVSQAAGALTGRSMPDYVTPGGGGTPGFTPGAGGRATPGAMMASMRQTPAGLIGGSQTPGGMTPGGQTPGNFMLGAGGGGGETPALYGAGYGASGGLTPQLPGTMGSNTPAGELFGDEGGATPAGELEAGESTSIVPAANFGTSSVAGLVKASRRNLWDGVADDVLSKQIDGENTERVINLDQANDGENDFDLLKKLEREARDGASRKKSADVDVDAAGDRSGRRADQAFEARLMKLNAREDLEVKLKPVWEKSAKSRWEKILLDGAYFGMMSKYQEPGWLDKEWERILASERLVVLINHATKVARKPIRDVLTSKDVKTIERAGGEEKVIADSKVEWFHTKEGLMKTGIQKGTDIVKEKQEYQKLLTGKGINVSSASTGKGGGKGAASSGKGQGDAAKPPPPPTKSS
ncbi:unnamed protein product [Amoebophrya sp. A120]|nr:unnamed protein product [Amoebophrya sp. A120]|eukprot:GSA120T00012514001.1